MRNAVFFLVIVSSAGLLFPQSISLDGEWFMAVDSSGQTHHNETDSLYWRTINVPSSWQASQQDLRDYLGIAWYKKSINVSSIDPDKLYLLNFNAVDYITQVWFNGNAAGKHEGGYTPFSFDVTKHIKQGKNEIVMRVLDPQYDPPGTEGVLFQDIPHGKQDWYVQTSGIWQSAAIDIKPKVYFKAIFIIPDISGKVDVTVMFNKIPDSGPPIKISVISPAGKEVIAKEILPAKSLSTSISLNISKPLLWNFETPNLYKLIITSEAEMKSEKFGFRKIDAHDQKLYLNGEPFYLIAALDQDFYPHTVYTTPSEEYIRDEMLKAKKLGLNMLRCHIKAPDPVYLKAADEIGLLVWYEIPNWSVYSKDAAKRGEATINAMLERDWNHPSLAVISIINESWGLDLSKKEQRDWLRNEYDRLKQKAHNRLIVDNSACWGNFHVKTDINDYHTYWAIPENRLNFDNTVKEVAGRPEWLFGNYGDSHQTGNEPLLISEFGNWGLPKLTGEDPWWFNRDFLDNQLVLPGGYNQRFLKYKYDEVFEDYNHLAENSQHAQFQALKYEIEQIRLHPEIQGYVITEFTDINWECNGLLDMWRNYKIYSDEIPLIQQQDIIIPRPVKYNYLLNEEAEIKIFVSRYSSRSLEGAEFTWLANTGESGSFLLPYIERTGVRELESVRFRIRYPGQTVRINFKISRNDTLMAENFTELYTYPDIDGKNISISTVKSGPEFSEVLGNYYYFNANSSIIITNQLDQDVLDKAAAGNKIICLADTSTIFAGSYSFKITSRSSDWYDGNWASNLNWKKSGHPFFTNINPQKYFGFEIAHSVPGLVITGIPEEKFTNVIAGMYVGWIQLNSAYIYSEKYGKGEIIICTIPVMQNYSVDPFVRTLLDNMIKE